MLKGLMLTPPIIGRIAIGKVVQKNGKRLPEKDDEFTITSQVQNKDGWVPHPIDKNLRGANGTKLRSIPIRLLFNEPELSLRTNYTMFDRTSGRPVCVGNGETCRRITSSGMQTLPCPSPEACEIAVDGNCKPFGRLTVLIDGAGDETGSFILRTTGFNSIRTLATRLNYFAAISGQLLATLPLQLVLRAKTSNLSHRSILYFTDITLRPSTTLAEAITTARNERDALENAGFDQAALDAAATAGFSAGEFDESYEDGCTLIEEFYHQEEGEEQGLAESKAAASSKNKLSLSDKLRNKRPKARASATFDGN